MVPGDLHGAGEEDNVAILKLDREANTQAVGQMFCLQHRDGCGKDVGVCPVCDKPIVCGDDIWIGWDEKGDSVDAHDRCVGA